MTDQTDAAIPRSLGPGGPRVGAIAYGCWRFADAVTDADVEVVTSTGTGTSTGDGAIADRITSALGRAQAKIETALDVGMTLIDTAAIYGIDGPGGFGSAEALLGEVLRVAPRLRDRMVLATKGGIVPGVPYDSTDLRAQCETSLDRLGVDVIDLYQVHRPDLLTHPGAVAEALAGLVEDGLVRAVGVSNHSPHQHEALQAHLGDLAIATIQPELSLAHLDPLDDGTLDVAMRAGCTPLAWSPLGGGSLVQADPTSGVGRSDSLTAVRAVMAELAEREDVSPSAIALAWVLAHPSAPIPIIGTQRLDRIQDAATATNIQLSHDDWYRLTAAAGRRLP